MSSDYRILDSVDSNILICNKNLIITYANKKSIGILNALSDLLPDGVSGDTIVGTNIDVFHKDQSHQRHMLADLNNLPHDATISLGKEFLDLHIEALRDRLGKHTGYMLCWSVSTKAQKLDRMVNKMPINVMMADPETFEITYVNETSIETLRQIEDALPIKADQLLGQCIDIFHQNPGRVRDMLKDPSNLPHHATIKVGSHFLRLDVSAIMTDAGAYLGPMLSWQIVTQNYDVVDNFDEVTGRITQTFDQLEQTAQVLQKNVEHTKRKADSMVSVSHDSKGKIETIATAAEEFSASIQEIAQQVSNASHKSEAAATQSQRSIENFGELSEASKNIGNVVSLINDIASQINLLALNATIESARAGEAGRGFAVVSGEVKNLANQTAKATNEIADQVKAIQDTISQSVDDMNRINEHVVGLKEANTIIAAAIEEQTSVASNINENIQMTSVNVKQMSDELREVSTTAESSEEQNGQLNAVSKELEGEVGKLKDLVDYASEKMGVKRQNAN